MAGGKMGGSEIRWEVASVYVKNSASTKTVGGGQGGKWYSKCGINLFTHRLIHLFNKYLPSPTMYLYSRYNEQSRQKNSYSHGAYS